MSFSDTKAIFLDRDGIINVDHGYVYKREDFEFNDGIFELLARFQEEGYLLIIVTNQSGIGRGYYSEEAYRLLCDYIIETFKEKEIHITAMYHCPHRPDEDCTCRKPKSGMLELAQKAFSINMQESWMIGDKESDMLAAVNAGVARRVLVSKKASEHATKRVESIKEI